MCSICHKKKHKITKKNDSLKLTAKAPENRLFQKERIVFPSIHFQVQICCKFQGWSWFTTLSEGRKKKTAHPFGSKRGTSQKGATLAPWENRTSLSRHFQPLLLGSPAYACRCAHRSVGENFNLGQQVVSSSRFKGMKNQVQ